MPRLEKISAGVSIAMKLIAIGLLITLAALKFPLYWKEFKEEFFSTSENNKSKVEESEVDNSETQQSNFAQKEFGTDSLLQQCSISNPFEDNYDLMHSASLSIRSIIQSAIADGVDLDQLDIIAYETGLPTPILRFEYARQQNYTYTDKYPNETIPIFGDPSWLDSVNKESLRLTLEVNNISKQEVLSRVSTSTLDNTNFYIYDGKKTTLLGFLYTKAPWFSLNDIEDIIDAGYSPTLSDLGLFTSEGIDLETIQLLWRHVSGDVLSVHKYPPTYESLASIALVHGNFKLLKFWISQGSPINPDPLGVSALAKFLFAKKQQLYSQEEEEFIINEIAKAPLSQSDYTLLTSVFNKYIDSEFGDEANIYSIESLGDKAHRLAQHYIIQVSAVILDSLKTKPMSEECSKRNVRYNANYIFSRLKAKQLASQGRLNAVSASIIEMEISDFVSNISLSKLEKGADIKRMFLEKANELKKERISSTTKEASKTIDAVLAAAKANNWKQALELLDQVETSHEAALNTLFSIALSTTSDKAVFIDLINRGAQIPDNAYIQLLISDNTEVVAALIPLGLNIDEPFLRGGDVIKDVVKLSSPEMLKLFLKSGATPNLEIDGMDALDVLLERFSLKGDDVVFMQLLMQNISGIEKSHTAFAFRLAKNSPSEFEYIKDNYPNLTEFRE